ncbi:MAG: DHH family phosphoesterase [archaeon]|jgi:nanoRNase/pAp phosphatase (c-di-AMP/oligoRNAs hydrolase)
MFEKLKGKRVLLLTHEHADLDSFCSAAIMREVLLRKKISSVIGVPSRMSEQAMQFALSEKISFQLDPDFSDFGAIIIFDFNDFEQLGKLREKFLCLNKSIKVFAFDHHVIEKRSIVRGKNAVLDENCVSTTQLLFKEFGKSFSKKAFFYACIGIFEDTSGFIVSNADAFFDFAFCLKKSGKNYADVLFFSRHKIPDDERIAFFKAAQRAQVQDFKGTVIVTSTLSFYQSAAASKLLELGAHIALVCGSEKNGSTTLSGRLETGFMEKKHFSLMKHVLVPLQKELGGEIGGHPGAAQWKGSVPPEQVLEKCVKIIKSGV